MDILLNEESEAFIISMIETGRYQSAACVVADALLLLNEQGSTRRENLRALPKEEDASLRPDRPLPFDPKKIK
ncbi:MAG: type II toxin-antitoxin system ParD family antitoxin [Alcanivoracaceae bacterium]|nr:type II toxin-antitoxin system ParD family antitoxin [Alcanivoracaceae bacterium]